MKSYKIPCSRCLDLTRVKAEDVDALHAWYKLQKKNGKAILCKACRRKQ